MIARLVQLGGVAVGVAGLLATAYLMIMTTFMVYDDEGFVLMSLRRFLAGDPLYDVVFSQYGPAPYLYHWIMTGGGTWELTHMFGRTLTLGHWVICAVGVGWMAYQFAGPHRGFAGIFAGLFSFNLLWQMVAEPSHPGSMIAAALTVAAGLAVGSIRRETPDRMAIALGLVGAVLVFTKINVGAFFISGVGAFALTCSAWPDRLRPPARWAGAAGLLVLPWLLMAGNLDDPAMLAFALKASLVGAAMGWILPAPTETSRIPAKLWLHTLGWFAAGAIAIIGFILLQGTSMRELINAVFIDPLRQPGNFTVPPRSSPHSTGFALISFGVVGWAGWQRHRLGEITPMVHQMARGLRLLLVAGLVFFAGRWSAPWGVFTYLDYVLPMLPLWLVRPRDAYPDTTWAALACLGFLAVTQVLHAYPVAGSQIGWGSFLSVAVIAIGLAGDIRSLHQQAGPWFARGVMAAAIIAAVIGTVQLGQTGWQRYHRSSPLPFAGAGDIRLDDRTRIALTAMIQNAAVHSDVLFTRQGMYSFNIWSQVPPPTSRNATHWFWLLDQPEQQDVINRLRTASKSAFIVNLPLDEFLAQIDVAVAGPLQEFVESHYESAFTLRGFDFRLPHGQQGAKFGYAQLFLPEDGPTEASPETPFTLRLDALIQGRPASLEVIEFDGQGNGQPSALAFVAPQFSAIRSDGSIMAEARPLTEAGYLEGIYSITARTNRPAKDWNFRHKGVIIRDEAGNILAEALFE